MIRRFCRWILEDELFNEYIRGWQSGVDQHRLEPESCDHHVTDPFNCLGEI